jgi:hypothetical protein
MASDSINIQCQRLGGTVEQIKIIEQQLKYSTNQIENELRYLMKTRSQLLRWIETLNEIKIALEKCVVMYERTEYTNMKFDSICEHTDESVLMQHTIIQAKEFDLVYRHFIQPLVHFDDKGDE